MILIPNAALRATKCRCVGVKSPIDDHRLYSVLAGFLGKGSKDLEGIACLCALRTRRRKEKGHSKGREVLGTRKGEDMGKERK